MGPGETLGLIFVAASMATVLIAVTRGPMGKALADRIAGRTGRGPASPNLAAEVEDLRQRVTELEDVRGDLVELQERLDFAERLLAKQREAEPQRRNLPS